MKKLLRISLLVLLPLHLFAQFVPVHVSYDHVYSFIDELASEKLISTNSAIKPYGRQQISKWLLEVAPSDLNRRQQKELAAFKKAFRLELGNNSKEPGDVEFLRKGSTSASLLPMGFFYADSVSSVAFTPIMGGVYYKNDNGTMYHRWVGAQMYGSYNKWGFYGSLRDNAENQPFSKQKYLINRTGGNYKATDYSEMRGGITYANKWFMASLAKDHLSWGTNYHGSNIIGFRTPSYAHLKMRFKPTKWFELNSMHGWLVSHLIDSANTLEFPGGAIRAVMLKKFVAANMFTLYPWRHTSFSFGNSVVYAGDNMNPTYALPFMLYKAKDATITESYPTGEEAGRNTQFFMEISTRALKHLHLYYTFFADDLKTSRWSKVSEHNFFSYKLGAKLTNWPVRNTRLGIEYTKTKPMTYRYDSELTTYESNVYTLGHYLGDNADELVLDFRLKPMASLWLDVVYTKARKGESYLFDRNDETLYQHRFMETEVWRMTKTEVTLTHQIADNVLLFGSVAATNYTVYSYTPVFFRGKQTTLSGGLAIGF